MRADGGINWNGFIVMYYLINKKGRVVFKSSSKLKIEAINDLHQHKGKILKTDQMKNTFTEYSDLVKYKAEIRTLEILKTLSEGDTPEDIRKCLKKHLNALYNEIEKLEEDVRNLKRQIR